VTIAEFLETHFSSFHAQSILDVGPGYADFSRIAARVTGARQITFVDCSKEVLDWQAQQTRDAGSTPVCIEGLIEPEVFATLHERFDIIHCQEVLEHLPQPGTVLNALVDLLSPSGRMVITVPTARSERWITFLNPSYMKDEPHGHINQFSAQQLRSLIESAGLEIMEFRPINPEYFVGHSWLFGTRMIIEGSTGRILTEGIRGFAYGNLTKYSRLLFNLTGPRFWSRLLPRNYFVIAQRHESPR
jgi:2-polyprenyl-6-hydroxyphenyl methylase/3-demethylubiquinone-9 3-methyltransferase